MVCTDEMFLHPDPLPGRDDWCRARVAETARRLDALDPGLPTVLANHWPLHREPTAVLRYPEFALWCGTELTEDWHTRFRATAVVYGHLHIPRTIWRDGVRFAEVSLGYPREWGRRDAGPQDRAASCRPARRPAVIEHLLPSAASPGAAFGANPTSAPLFPEEAPPSPRPSPSGGASSPPAAPAPASALAGLGSPAGRSCATAPRRTRSGPTASSAASPTAPATARRPSPAATDILTLGIDAEPHGRLPEGVLGRPSSPPTRERAALAALARRPGSTGTGCCSAPRRASTRRGTPYHRRGLGFDEAEPTFHRGHTPAPQGRRAPTTPDRGGTPPGSLVPGPLLAEGVGPEVFTRPLDRPRRPAGDRHRRSGGRRRQRRPHGRPGPRLDPATCARDPAPRPTPPRGVALGPPHTGRAPPPSAAAPYGGRPCAFSTPAPRRDQEERLPSGPPSAQRTAPVQLDRRQHLAALAHPHAPLVRHVGGPDRTLRVSECRPGSRRPVPPPSARQSRPARCEALEPPMTGSSRRVVAAVTVSCARADVCAVVHPLVGTSEQTSRGRGRAFARGPGRLVT